MTAVATIVPPHRSCSRQQPPAKTVPPRLAWHARSWALSSCCLLPEESHWPGRSTRCGVPLFAYDAGRNCESISRFSGKKPRERSSERRAPGEPSQSSRKKAPARSAGSAHWGRSAKIQKEKWLQGERSFAVREFALPAGAAANRGRGEPLLMMSLPTRQPRSGGRFFWPPPSQKPAVEGAARVPNFVAAR